MPMILGAGKRRSLGLDTAVGSPIPNEQGDPVAEVELRNFVVQASRWGNARERRGPSGYYNCHGLTFASGRTCVDPEDLAMVLSEDKYEEVPSASVKAGDVILYYSEDGEAEHSGLVVVPPSEGLLNVPVIVSKWGRAGEYVWSSSDSMDTKLRV